MKYVSYRRVSKRERDTGSCSLGWQAAEIARWCEKKGVELADDFSDDGQSAGRPLRRRPKGAALLAAAADGDCTIIVAKADRIFRETEEFLTTWSQWMRQGVVLKSANDELDMLSAAGKLTATIQAAVAEYERETIGERTRTRIQHRKQAGLRYLRDARYGFRFQGEVVDENGKKSGGTEVMDESEQATIAKMKDWQSRGWTLRKIASALNVAGVPTRRGKPWKHSSVAEILSTAKARLSKKKGEDGKGHVSLDLNVYLPHDIEEGDK